MRLGAYLAEAPPDRWPLDDFERLIGGRCSIVSFYWAWGLGLSPAPFDSIRAIVAAGRTPMVTWEPWRLPPAGADPLTWPGNAAYAPARIRDGAFDAYIDAWAHELGTIGGTVYLRPMHEANGNWYPWCGTATGNRPEIVRAAWRHLHDRFARRGVDTVRWVFSPYALSVPGGPANAIERYYPGGEYVDRLALDAFNWGTTRPWARWQTVRELVDDGYATLSRLGDQPMMIAELGSAEAGGDKGAWLADGYRDVTERYPRIDEVVWFSIDKECDWRVQSSARSLASFRDTWGRGCAS